MTTEKKIVSIQIDKLIAHPGNPNRMSGETFKKLLKHIERSGNYEPVVVREHPVGNSCFEIINGHHRVEVLRELGAENADCVVWDVDDDEVLILLATLNRLSGNDDLYKKSELIKKLHERFDIKQLIAGLPDSKKTIQRLKDLQKPLVDVNSKENAFLNTIVFFISNEQKLIVDRAIALADEKNQGTRSQKRAIAIVDIAAAFIRSRTNE